MKLKKGDCKKMAEAASATDAPKMGCGDCYEVLDAFAEQILAGKKPEEAMPLVEAHLQSCPCCHEEFNVLLEALKAQRSAEEADA
ncbi:MAG: hypothetical protein AAGJ10_17180 [Bacteroidota bacterium]